MAVTAIWDIKNSAERVIAYAVNPSKTKNENYEALAALHAIDNVLEYAADDMKTEMRYYVSGINCDPDFAAQQFMHTKRAWGKENGIVAYHGYQSFRENEVTAEQAHAIGCKLASRLWGDRFEVVVATHLNTGHYHNHLVLNSVSFTDGYKYYDQKKTYYELRRQSDQLCREYGISVIKDSEGRSKNHAEWQAEKDGKTTVRGTIRADIDQAVQQCLTSRDFVRAMESTGYEFKLYGDTGQKLKYPGIKPPGAKGYFRFHKLGADYTPEAINERILQNIRRRVPLPEERKPIRRYRLASSYQRAKKATGFRALYYYYCYKLHIFVRRPDSVKRAPFSMREDLTKLSRLDAEMRFLARTKIGTTDELSSYRAGHEKRIETLVSERKGLRNELKKAVRQDDTPDSERYRVQIAGLSGEITKLRKEVRICESIGERSRRIKENLEQLRQDEKPKRKEERDNERIGRSGGSGR